MKQRMAQFDADELLVHAGWLRGLALRIVRDPDVADDLVQETWAATIRRSPDTREPVKPWLAKVMLNALRMRVRSEGRRAAREQATLVAQGEVPTPDQLVARAEAQRVLVDLVLRLDEPYRSTVLLHFCEGITLADIARAQGVAAGTVRWRLKVAIDQLRRWLDEQSNGKPHWAVSLLAVPKGVLVAQTKTKLIAAAIAVLLLLLVVGGVIWRMRSGGAGDANHPASSATAAAGGAASTTMGAIDPNVPAWLRQPGVAARRIAGRVVFRGAPVAGASVELASLASEHGLATAPRRTTNAAGEFDFGAQPAMEWNVRASAPGKTSAAIDVDLRNPSLRPAPDHLELELVPCDAAMFGTVRDASGGAIAKARIAHLMFEQHSTIPGGPAVTSDEKGAYELCVQAAWPGWVSVEVSADGYGAIAFRTMVPGRMKVDFALVPEATIVGRVVRDDTGEPVPQAYVFVPFGAYATERSSWRGTFSDASGKFRLERVAPGRHMVFARGAGMVDSSHGVEVIVEAGQTTSEIEIRLEQGSTIRGVVVDHGKPVAGARVAVDARGATSAVSQQDGTFVLAQVPRGELRFTAIPYDVVKPTTFRVTQPEHTGVTLEVESLGTITGHVVRNKRPVAGARIDIHGPNENDLDEIRTNADGRFEARGLRPGPWTLFAGYDREGAFGGPKTVKLERGATADVTIDLTFAASIAGRVIDQTGAPVAGVAVWFENTSTDDGGVAVTSIDGTFRAATMTGGGQYRPSVRRNATSTALLKPAAGTEFPLISLSDGDASVTGVVLAVQLDHLTIAGKVVDANGAPVADARVVAEIVEQGQAPRFFRGVQDPATTTSVDGRFAITDLLAGSYALYARSPDGGDATLESVRAGKTDVTIVLPNPGTIEGTIVGFKSTPQVIAIKRGSSAPVNGVLQGNAFVMRGLAPGSYTVTARSTTEAATASVDVIAGRTARATLTSRGTGVVAGRVLEFRTNKPIEGMTCRAMARAGTAIPPIGAAGDGARTDAQGAFLINAAPAGDIAVFCDGLWRLYSDGARLVTLQSSLRLDVDVRVVAWTDELHAMAGFGAELDTQTLVARLIRVKPGGPAAVAGFVDNDIVVAVDGASVTELSHDGVWILISNHPPGTKVKLTVTRAGKPISGELVLSENPGR